MSVRNNILPFLVVFILCTIPSSVFSQELATSEIVVEVGDTFLIQESVQSTYYRWELTDYDARKVGLIRENQPDTIGKYGFGFEAFEPGQVDLTLSKIISTQLGEETKQTKTYTVTIREEQEGSTVPLTPKPPAYEPNPDTVIQPEKEQPPRIDEELWDEAQELIEIERYDEAREIIQEQIKQAGGEARRQWHELLAKSYKQEEDYESAIEEWRNLMDDFPGGPIPKWLLSISKAHREMGNDDEAELVLLKIRHQHPNSEQWPEAMEMLADIAIQREQIDRARDILERAQSFYKGQDKPRLILRLARLYDEFPPLRDYERAVKLYQRAANQLQNSDPETAREARNRAQHLLKNYVRFGTE